jgi:hypothetical protein
MRLMTAQQREFDPTRHIRAADLRRLGVSLRSAVAGRQFVRRAAVGFDPTERVDDGQTVPTTCVLEPFMTQVD